MPQPPTTVDDLGLQGCLAFWALLTGQSRRLPIAPTRTTTLAAMELLRGQGVIAVPWPHARWQTNPAAQETPLEGLQWMLVWHVYEPEQLIQALADCLEATARDELGLGLRLRLWNELAAAEAERFLEQQLMKHRFPGDWATDITFAFRDYTLSLAQWRYCAWAAVRQGGSLAAQYGVANAPHLRERIYAELRQRASRITSGTWANCALPPFHATPESAFTRGFLQFLAPLGLAFWTMPPSIDALVLPNPPAWI